MSFLRHDLDDLRGKKETDVNIAVTLVEDAALRCYDTALVISADSDLCPADALSQTIAQGQQRCRRLPTQAALGRTQKGSRWGLHHR